MKVLKPERTIDPGTTFEFEREGQLLVELQDEPNVVSILESNTALAFDFSHTGNSFVLPVRFHRLELADGCLDEIAVGTRDSAYWKQMLPLFRDVVAGVHQMHRNGIVHRDLKTSNVLLFENRPHGERGQVSDLGRSCRLADSPRFQGDAYVHGRGDPSFAPPELLLGAGVADPTAYRLADLYLVGSVLCELVTGQGATSLLMPQWVAANHRVRSAPPAGQAAVIRAEMAALRPQLAMIGDLVRSLAPPAVRHELVRLFLQLCDPVPSRRDLRCRRDRNLPHTDLAWLLRRVQIIQKQFDVSQVRPARRQR